MIGYIAAKRTIKRTAGWAAVMCEPLLNRPRSIHACILMYHRVANIRLIDPELDDWNVPPQLFERQIATLAEYTDVVPLHALREKLAERSASEKPLVALTFDDGYASFFTQSLPVLERYGMSATVFVVTSAVGNPGPLAFDAWSRKHSHHVPPEVCRSMNWRELEASLDTGLVAVGSHSHRHMSALACSPTQLLAEAQQSRAILLARLGQSQGNAYAYPYGTTRLGLVPPQYVDAVRNAGYRLAVCTNVGVASPECDQYLLPRMEATPVDHPRVLRAKTNGVVAPFHLVERMRFAKRAI